MKKAISILFALGLGVGTLWMGTGGFLILTSEGERYQSIEENPVSPPNILLRDQSGKLFRIDDLRGSHVLVEFIYTRCATLCHELGRTFEIIAQDISDELRNQKIYLLSISFDPHDTTEDLENYGYRYDANPSFWKISKVENKADLKLLLDIFGITVIPDQQGDFQHNAAVHFINIEGKLDKIIGISSTSQINSELDKRLK